MNIKIAPSLMSMNMLNVQAELDALNPYADVLHIDIIDWHYIKNMCLTPHFIKQIRPYTSVPIEAHLYVDNIDIDLIDTCIDAGADIITMPSDCIQRSANRFINHIHSRGAKAGVFINPTQPCDVFLSYASRLDHLIVLGVDPGFGEQTLLENTYDRISEIRDTRDKLGYNYTISIDGNCNKDNMKKLAEAGCDVLIMGRGLFEREDSLEQSLITTKKELAAL